MSFTKSEIKNLVKQFFPDLQNKEVDLFLDLCKYDIYKNKEIIFKSGRTDKTVFLILKGSARAFYITEKGQEFNCHIRSRGYVFGDPKVFGDEIQPLNIESIGEIHILKFDIKKMESIGYNNPKFMAFYLGILKEIILVFSHRIDSFVTMTSKERYQDLVKWNPFYLKSTFDKHIASFLGIKPLTLHRIKKQSKNIK